jgi:outer membrane protein assembly factor BamA
LTAVLVLASAAPRCLHAQTYNPKSIRFESTDASQPLDTAELLRITGLHQGTPLSKAEIEDALHKLGDSGAFSNLAYTVSDAALTFRLTPAGGGQALPVRFANFVWWQPDELLQLLESRVPLFHGELPLQGNQTGEVEDALTTLLRDKGIPDARVTAMPSSSKPNGPIDTVALSITSPEVLVGGTDFEGSVPALEAKLNSFNRELAGRDFDRQDITDTIHSTTQEYFEDAGYLDITSEPPVFSAPRKDLDRYAVDIQVNLHPGALYRVGAIAIHPEPPLSESDLRSVLPFKSGDAASASLLRTAANIVAHAYADRGFLAAHASAAVHKDSANHTIDYSFTFSPGAQFHLASVNTSALPPDVQQEFAGLWHIAPGTLADRALFDNLRATVGKLHTRLGIVVNIQPDTTAHTVVLALQPRKLPGIDPVPREDGTPLEPSNATAPQTP